ncbi:MAG: PAS domain-containing protein [Candidatus Bathyarchaeia archaeon]
MADKFSGSPFLQVNEFTSEQIFRSALKNTPVTIFVLDTELRYTWIYNPSVGQPAEKFIGKKVGEMNKPKDASALINFYSEVLKSGLARQEEFKLEFEDKAAFYEIYALPLKNSSGEVTGLVAASTDATHHKKAEQELWRAKDDWERTFDSVPDFIAILDNQYRIVRANRAMAQQLGVTPEKAIGLFCYQCVHGLDNPPDFCPHSQTVKDGEEHTAEVYEPRLGGDFLVSTTPLRDEEGRIIGSVHVARNITERKKAEEYLQKQAELIDLSPDAIIIKKLDDTITFWSKGAEKLYGWTKEEAIGQRTSLLFRTKSSEALKDIILKLKQTGNWSGELTHYTKDGKELVVQSWWLGKPDEQGKIKEILESNIDISERKRIQIKQEENASLLEEYANQMEELANERAKQLKENERLAAIGQTAGMVGHDIRNPLQAIVGELYLAKDEVVSLPDSNAKKNLQESITCIEENLFYIDKIIADLQDYTKPLKPNKEKVNIEKAIEEALLIVYIPNNLQVSISIEEDFPQFTADFAMLKRALINLIQNAVHAMPNGGSLNINARRKGKHACIGVEDTGEGIPEEVKSKLFTPLFTTKSKGQGFGLAVAKRLVEAQGGKISFESGQGKGTTFTIQLPLTY